MKKNFHPSYVDCTVVCACGHSFATRNVKPELRVEICSACHPFYTGNRKLLDTEGRVQKFMKKYEKKSVAVPSSSK